MYEEVKWLLQKFIRKGPTLWLTSPVIKDKYLKPHYNIMAIGLLHQTSRSFSILKQLWQLAEYQMVVTLLEGPQNEIATTLSNEQLYIYSRAYILEQLDCLGDDVSHLITYLDRPHHGYKEMLIMIGHTVVDDFYAS